MQWFILSMLYCFLIFFVESTAKLFQLIISPSIILEIIIVIIIIIAIIFGGSVFYLTCWTIFQQLASIS